jgi:uncharacterized peroxidase-related enzyme
MAWIQTVEEAEADEALRAVYNQVKDRRGKISNILSVHSLHPETLRAHMDLYMAILFGDCALSREQREMIAVVVSSTNRCAYCIHHHAAALDHYWRDEKKLSDFVTDFRSVALSDGMRAVLEYAYKLTSQPDDMAEADVQRLRDAALSDKDILIVNLIVSYFNFVNRIALGLGVSFSPDEIHGYKY